MKETIPFEILVATMYRTNLDFLEAMFPEETYNNYHILVVNQTDKERQLQSNVPSVRIINSFERGLSQSRNLAVGEATGEVCLVADDDVRYVKNLEKIVLNAYAKNKNASIITFQMTNFEGDLYQKYPDPGRHTSKTIRSVNGVVISFKPKVLRETNTYYDPHFGLGCTFQTANEFVFMKNALKANLKAIFQPMVILSHPNHSSGRDMGSDRVVYARAALTHKYYGFLSYLWVFKFMRYLVAYEFIGLKEVPQKIKVGFSGIAKFRKINT